MQPIQSQHIFKIEKQATITSEDSFDIPEQRAKLRRLLEPFSNDFTKCHVVRRI